VSPHQPLSFGGLLCVCSPFLCRSQYKLLCFPLDSILWLVVVFVVLGGHQFPPNHSITIEHCAVMCEPVLFLLLINCCDGTSPTIRFHKLVDCYVCELRLLLQQPAHLLCISRPRGASLVHIHQTISVVLMARSTASARSPAATDVADDVGWVEGWFWGDAVAAGHGFGG
jgi:hypothetical protein